MKVLVMGGTRFNGLALVRELTRRGHDVTVLNRGQTLGTYTKEEITLDELQNLMAGGQELQDLARRTEVGCFGYRETHRCVHCVRGLRSHASSVRR